MTESLNILYVDDEFLNLQVLEIFLGAQHKIFSFSSAMEAREYLDREKIDLDIIISDFLMKDENGLEFKNNLCQEYQRVPFVILSGFIKANQIQEALDSGTISAYLEKPLDQEELSELLEDLVS